MENQGSFNYYFFLFFSGKRGLLNFNESYEDIEMILLRNSSEIPIFLFGFYQFL